MNRTDVLRHIASLRAGAPMIISPGLANYPIAAARDEPLTIYNMDMPYTTPMALGMALGWPERKVISIEGDGSLLAGPGVLSTVARYQPKNLLIFVFDNGAYLTTGSGKAPTATAFGHPRPYGASCHARSRASPAPAPASLSAAGRPGVLRTGHRRGGRLPPAPLARPLRRAWPR